MSSCMRENTVIEDLFGDVVHTLQISDLAFSLLDNPRHNISSKLNVDTSVHKWKVSEVT
jgi:hypothetical protein